MAVIFKHRTKQDRLDLLPGVPLAFDDDRAEDYFVAAGFAARTKQEPAVTYPEGSVAIDPFTTHAADGKRVMEG